MSDNKTLARGNTAFPSGLFFWLICFAYASFTALIFQKAVLPLLPEMHAGHGLLTNDAIVFHNLAVVIAQRIQSVGWSAWSLYPPGFSGNVGLLSAIYAVFGPDPAWFIPLNAAAHATGALLIYRIGCRLVDGDAGKLGGVVVAIAFLVSPSSLQWYGQNHKDAFSIMGVLLVLDAWLGAQRSGGTGLSDSVKSIGQVALGAVFLGVMRPYYVVLVAVGAISSFAVTTVWDLLRKSLSVGCTVRLASMVVVLAGMGYLFAQFGSAVAVFGEIGVQGKPTASYVSDSFHWESTDVVPSVVDKALHRASELRAHFVVYGRRVGAGSEIDGDRLPNSVVSALAYLPRALFVGLFSPFPESWADRVTLPRLIGAMETAIWYVFVLGAGIAVARHKSRRLLSGAVFCAILILIFAYVHPNVGTLYRQRYGVWHFFMLIGAIGWASLILDGLEKRGRQLSVVAESTASIDKLCSSVSGKSLAASGAVVLLITLAGYLGFFARDLLLIGHLGMGVELDAFFSAAMIPMFFVSCLAMPLGDAFVISFLSAKNSTPKSRDDFLRGVLGLGVLILGVAALLVVAIAPLLVGSVLGTASQEKAALATGMLRWFAPIIALSAWTVIGNAALNSLGMQRASALGQLVVPVITVAGIAFSPPGGVVAAGVGGMVLGTSVNALFVAWRLRMSGLLLLPSFRRCVAWGAIFRLYFPLMASAVLPAVLVPINYSFAASVSVGMVAAWAFASKIVALFSGLATVGATSIVLPHLTRVFGVRKGSGAHRDANFLIALGIWLGGGLMLGGFLFAEPLVAAVLGKDLQAAQVAELIGIVKVGMLQLPVVISGALVNKLAIAAGRSSRVMYSAVFSFVGNLLLNILLVPKLGVVGVAIGSLAGVTLGTIVVLVSAFRCIGLAPREMFIAQAGWLAWVAVCVALASGSLAALVSAAIVLVGIGRVQWSVLRGVSLMPRAHTA